MTLEEERKDFLTYAKIVRRFGFSFPVRDEDRPALDTSLLAEYRRIQRKESKMSPNERKVIVRIFDMAAAEGVTI